MKNKKRKYFTIWMLLFILLSVSACGAKEINTEEEQSQGLKIVTTVFPPYDFAKQIIGDKGTITMLLSPGVESHSYEPTPKDMIAIKECDLFIYGGGESDTWVEDLLDGISNSDMQTLKMMDCVDTRVEETLEGMEHAESEEHGHIGKEEYDEHVWTSPKNAMKIVTAIMHKMTEIDTEHADFYIQNGQAYLSKLEELDEAYETWRGAAKEVTLVFGDRFPFLYLAKDYNLECYAAFPGCSAETEPSAATIAFLIDKVKEKNLKYVFHLELSNAKVANAIAEATGAESKMLHSCHNISADELDAGVTYIGLMEQNLDTLREAIQ